MLLKIALFVCLFLPTTVQALTLDEVVSSVVTSHPSILQSRQRTKRIAAMKRTEVWLENPQVGVMFEESPENDFGLGNADMTNYTLSQEVPNPFVLKHKSDGFKNEILASEHMTTSVTREQIFEAKKIFFELVANQNARAAKMKLIQYYDQIIGSLDKSYQADVPQQDPNGMSMTTKTAGSSLGDVLMAKMKKAEVQAEVLDLNHAVKSLSAKLNLIMGRPTGQNLGHIVAPRLKLLKFSNEDLEEKLNLANSDLMALSAMVSKAKSNIALTRAELLPGVMTDLTYHRRRDMDNAYSVGFSVKVPLWLNKNTASIAQAKVGYLESQYEKQGTELVLKQNLHFLAEHAREHYKILGTYRGQVLPLAESAINTALADHQASATTAISVLQKIVSYHEAVSMYWELWADYNVEFAMLENLIGEEL